MTTTGDDIVEELRQRGADSTLIANNAYVRAADEMAMLRGEIARCRQRGHLLAASLDIARKQLLEQVAEIERLRAAAVVSLLEKDGDQ